MKKKLLLSIFIIVTLFTSYNKSFAICYPYSGSWGAIDGNIRYGIDRFYVPGFAGSILNDSGIVGITELISWDSGYLNRTATIPTLYLQQGGVYAASATWFLPLYTNDIQVWVDFNDDELFETTEEVTPVSGWNATSTPNPTYFNISIPIDANLGRHLMRIRSVLENYPIGHAPAHLDPCLYRYLSTSPTYYAGDVVDYYVTILTNDTCTGTPRIDSTKAPDHVCTNSGFYLWLTGSSFFNGMTFQWQSSPDSTTWGNISGATAISFSYSQTATSFYRCLIKCTASGDSSFSIPKKVIYDSLLSAGTITGTSLFCAGVTDTFTVSGASAAGTWSISSSSVATLSPISATLASATGVSTGTAIIRYQLSNVCGLFTTADTINVMQLPVVGGIFAGSSTLCIGSTTTFRDTSNLGRWLVSNTFASIDSTGLVTGLAEGVDTITYTETNFCGTTNATTTIAIYPAPDAGYIYGPDTVCTFSTITIFESVPGGIWNPHNGDISITTSGVVMGLYYGYDTIDYGVRNACGLAISAPFPIFICNPLDPATISGLDSVCIGDSINLTSSYSDGVWSASNAHVSINASTGILTGVSAGITTINYTRRNVCGPVNASFLVYTKHCINGIPETNPNTPHLKIYPNPANDVVSIEWENLYSENTTIEISDFTGRIVYSNTFKPMNANGVKTIQPTLAQGVYIVSVESGTVQFKEKLVITDK